MLPSRLSSTSFSLLCVSLVRVSVGNPVHHWDVRGPSLEDSPLGQRVHAGHELSPIQSLPNRYTDQHHDEATPALVKRTKAPIGGCQLIQRYTQSAIVPTVSSVAALKGFWQTISMKALYNSASGEAQKSLFTIKEGVLMATFSCLGQEVPWDFVQDFAMNLVGMVDMGWTDTFDAIYENAAGHLFWVSLRVLVKATKKRKPTPGA